MQAYGSVYRGAFHCGLSILKNEGISAFYVSYPTTLMMTIPFQSIHFATYEYFCKTMNPSGRYDPKTHIVAGGLAGAIAAACTTPLDVAKTLLQVKGNSSDITQRNCNGMLDALRIIYNREGIGGFFRGMRPRVLTHMPSTAMCWTTYEFFKWFITRDDN